MEHQVAIATICAAFAFGVLAQFIISQKAMRITLYLVAIPIVVSLAIVAVHLRWYR